MDWFTPLVGFLGLAIGFGYQEYRIRRERKDKYKDMVFERRLDAHQEVYSRLTELLGSMLPHRLMQEGGVAALVKEIAECHKCMDRNALYLAKDSRIGIVVFLGYARKKCKRYMDAEWVRSVDVKKEAEELVKNMGAVLNIVERGIGVKYLPEEKTRVADSFLQEVTDEAIEGAERLARKQKA